MKFELEDLVASEMDSSLEGHQIEGGIKLVNYYTTKAILINSDSQSLNLRLHRLKATLSVEKFSGIVIRCQINAKMFKGFPHKGEPIQYEFDWSLTDPDRVFRTLIENFYRMNRIQWWTRNISYSFFLLIFVAVAMYIAF